MLVSHLEGHLQSQKGPIWTFMIYYGDYLRNRTDVAMKYTFEVIDDLSVYLWIELNRIEFIWTKVQKSHNNNLFVP